MQKDPPIVPSPFCLEKLALRSSDPHPRRHWQSPCTDCLAQHRPHVATTPHRLKTEVANNRHTVCRRRFAVLVARARGDRPAHARGGVCCSCCWGFPSRMGFVRPVCAVCSGWSSVGWLSVFGCRLWNATLRFTRYYLPFAESLGPSLGSIALSDVMLPPHRVISVAGVARPFDLADVDRQEEYVGRHEKTKAIVKLQKRGLGAPS